MGKQAKGKEQAATGYSSGAAMASRSSGPCILGEGAQYALLQRQEVLACTLRVVWNARLFQVFWEIPLG